jgi:hypothetical protein
MVHFGCVKGFVETPEAITSSAAHTLDCLTLGSSEYKLKKNVTIGRT